jgi:hypothetical protein
VGDRRSQSRLSLQISNLHAGLPFVDRVDPPPVSWRFSCFVRGNRVTGVMLSKIWTAFLIVLAVSPFTAPFSTCELSLLSSRTSHDGVPPTRRASHAVSRTLPNLALSVARISARKRTGLRRLAAWDRRLSARVAARNAQLPWLAPASYQRSSSAFAAVLRL